MQVGQGSNWGCSAKEKKNYTSQLMSKLFGLDLVTVRMNQRR
jgi:hypothetical protein